MSTPTANLALELHPLGTSNPNGIINDNWQKVDDAAIKTPTGFGEVIAKTTTGDPTTRVNGNALQAGDVCINTFDKTIRVYAASAWNTAATWP